MNGEDNIQPHFAYGSWYKKLPLEKVKYLIPPFADSSLPSINLLSRETLQQATEDMMMRIFGPREAIKSRDSGNGSKEYILIYLFPLRLKHYLFPK